MKKNINVILCIGAIALSGCSSSSDEQTNVKSTSGTSQQTTLISDAVKNLYPDFTVTDEKSICEASDSLVGCYISNKCSSGDTSSRLYVTDITSAGVIASTLYLFNDSTTCTGNALPVGLSALDYTYVSGEDIVSQSGVTVTEINPTRVIGFGTQVFTTNYFSSYYLQNNELCFPDGDYNWDDDGGGISFNEQNASNRATDIDFENCMVKIR
jgi:hypothetical protein